MDLKEQLKKQLVANVIKDKCKNCDKIIFDEALCTQDRIIRFSTESHKYEAENLVDTLVIKCDEKTWTLDSKGDSNRLFEAFDDFLSVALPEFEKTLEESEILTEGNAEVSVSTKYERNPKARAACIAAHGTACCVCGIDFGETYGSEFAGKIEIHHIVPISEIGEEYVVDPVNDLVPVCPNCHTALHSKKGGVYTVEELKKIINK